MKQVLLNMAAGLVLAGLLVQPVAAAPGQVCLKLRDIYDTKPDKTGSSIFFTMRDGSAWRNTLHSRCPDLNFNGFEWTVHGPEEVCDDQQTIRVLQSGETCQIGKFTQVTPAPQSKG